MGILIHPDRLLHVEAKNEKNKIIMPDKTIMDKKILIIDETLREGMQYRGLMFSYEQRLKILNFQEKLGIDICQAGYPPAHGKEAAIIKRLCTHAEKQKYKIHIAAMGMANLHSADILLATGINDFHFHVYIKNSVTKEKLDQIFQNLLKTIEYVKKQNSKAVISVAMLDIGKTDDYILEKSILFLSQHNIEIISLPDTSGMMAPNQVFKKIDRFSLKTGRTKISIHCHNDMGMASANSVMGIVAGGKILEASALGIGERNGIADLYTSAKTLQTQGFDINLKTDDIDTFKAYYQYVDSIIFEQKEENLLNTNTPIFGDAVKTHVAGTHADGQFGIASEEEFFLNVLCGRQLVKKYLNAHKIHYVEDILDALTLNIKDQSLQLNRCLTDTEIQLLISSLTN
jgi:isopropylmalate/homocitrate/citramalate synthase